MEPRRSSTRIAAVAMVLAATVLPLVALLLAGKTFVWRDTAKIAEPTRALIVEALRSFELPLWNPHEAFGIPLLAQQMYGALHPVSVVMAWVAPHAGMDAFIVLYVALAACGAVLAARALGASWPASAVAGLAFGLSGYVLSMSSVIHYLGGAATAPWVIAGLVRAPSAGRRGIVAAAVAVGAAALAGEPQWLIVAVTLGGALSASVNGHRAWTSFGIAVAVGAALGALQLLPGWAFFSETQRAAGVAAADRSVWALLPSRLVELIAPGLFVGSPGAPVAGVFSAAVPRSPYGIPFVPSVFVGLIPLVLGVVALRRGRVAVVLALFAGVALWLALGPRGGADWIVRYLPVWGAFRYPEKLVGPFTLCVALLAALGTDALGTGRRALRDGAWATLALTVAGLMAGGLVLARPGWVATVAVNAELERLFHERYVTGLAALLITAAALVLCGVLLARVARARALAPLLAAGLVAVEGLVALPFALHLGARSERDPAPLAFLHQRTQVPRIGVPFPEVPTSAPLSPHEFERLSVLEAALGVPSYNVRSRVDSASVYTGQLPSQYMAVVSMLQREFGPAQFWVAQRRFALTHVVVGPLPDGSETTRAVVATAVAGGVPLPPRGRDDRLLWEVPHRAWAFFASDVVAARSGEESVDALLSVLERGSDAVVIEGPPLMAGGVGEVLSVTRQPNRVRIEVAANAPAPLVVNDAFWPGWEATIDGRPVEVHRADALVRAVQWPAGRHVLEMRYAPVEVTVAKWATGIALLFCVVLAWRGAGLRTNSSRAVNSSQPRQAA